MPPLTESWINEFIRGHEAGRGDKAEYGIGNNNKSDNAEARNDGAQERAKDIAAFDTLLKKHPEIAGKLRAQGIDLDAEKGRERERLKGADPKMPDAETDARAAITVYLRYQDAIHAAAPDDTARQEFAASFEHLKSYAREVGIPYQDSVRMAAGILPTDKAAIMAATTGTAFDTRAVRAGNTLSFESPSDRVTQVWTLTPGERPEKSLEIPNGPRIKIATAPEPDLATLGRKSRAIDRIAELTGWEGVRTPEGLEAARTRFPDRLTASLSDAVSAPNAWRAFFLAYCTAGIEDGKSLAAMMQSRISQIADPKLKQEMNEALDAIVIRDHALGDQRAELLGEIGKKFAGTIDSQAAALKSETEKKRDSFDDAMRTVDGATAQQNETMLGFRDRVAHAEGIARDNLAYFADNGFLAFGPHFDSFLSTLNARQFAVYPEADGAITLPKEFSEKDRAFLAHGLVKAIGPEENVADYFDLPGYRLKQADASGRSIKDKIESGLKASGVLKDGGIRLTALESNLQSVRRA